MVTFTIVIRNGKNSLEGSLDKILFAAKLELRKGTSIQATSAYIKFKH